MSWILLSLWFLTSVLANPILFSPDFVELVPRDHVECDQNDWGCHQVVTCDNDDHVVAGQLPPISSTTSSAPITLPTSNMNQVRTINLQSKGTANQLVPTPVLLSKTVSTGTQNTIALDNSASPSETLISTTRKETKKRQFSSTQWCLLGTTFYVLLQPFSGQSSNANVKSLMQSAVSQISQSLGASENTTIPAPSSPILSLFWNSGDRIDVYNLPGSSMTYYQLSLAVNLTNNYMSQNQYTAVGVQLINGTANIGRLQIV